MREGGREGEREGGGREGEREGGGREGGKERGREGRREGGGREGGEREGGGREGGGEGAALIAYTCTHMIEKARQIMHTSTAASDFQRKTPSCLGQDWNHNLLHSRCSTN